MEPFLSRASELAPSIAEFLPAQAFVLLATFSRVGMAFMTTPGFGDARMSQIARLAAAFTLSLALAPVAAEWYPPQPAAPLGLVGLIGGELLAGAFLGVCARAMFAALNVAGQIIGMQMGLSAAQAFDPSQMLQGALIGTFLATFGVVLVFVLDLHHLFIAAIIRSYELFPPGVAPIPGDLAQMLVDATAASFGLGLQLSAPFILYGIAFYAGAGVLARLMPQVQVFFVLMPAQVLAGLLVLMLTTGLILTVFFEQYEAFLSRFVG